MTTEMKPDHRSKHLLNPVHTHCVNMLIMQRQGRTVDTTVQLLYVLTHNESSVTFGTCLISSFIFICCINWSMQALVTNEGEGCCPHSNRRAYKLMFSSALATAGSSLCLPPACPSNSSTSMFLF